MQLSTLYQMFTASEVDRLRHHLRTLSDDPAHALLLETFNTPPSDALSITLCSYQCAVLAGCLMTLNFPHDKVLKALEYVSTRAFHDLALTQRLIFLDFLLVNEGWQLLERYVDPADLPEDWFNRYIPQRVTYLQQQITRAEDLLDQGHIVTPLVRYLQALDPDSSRIKLLMARSLMAEQQHKQAQSILMRLVLDPEFGQQARRYLDTLHPNYDPTELATTSQG